MDVENGEMMKRPEMVQGCFVGAIGNIGRGSALFSQLKSPETGNFGCFWLKIECFSAFPANPANAERVLKAVTMVVDSGDDLMSFEHL